MFFALCLFASSVFAFVGVMLAIESASQVDREIDRLIDADLDHDL